MFKCFVIVLCAYSCIGLLNWVWYKFIRKRYNLNVHFCLWTKVRMLCMFFYFLAYLERDKPSMLVWPLTSIRHYPTLLIDITLLIRGVSNLPISTPWYSATYTPIRDGQRKGFPRGDIILAIIGMYAVPIMKVLSTPCFSYGMSFQTRNDFWILYKFISRH